MHIISQLYWLALYRKAGEAMKILRKSFEKSENNMYLLSKQMISDMVEKYEGVHYPIGKSSKCHFVYNGQEK